MHVYVHHHHHQRLVLKRISVKRPHPCGPDVLQRNLSSPITKTPKEPRQGNTASKNTHYEPAAGRQPRQKPPRRTPFQTQFNPTDHPSPALPSTRRNMASPPQGPRSLSLTLQELMQTHTVILKCKHKHMHTSMHTYMHTPKHQYKLYVQL